MRNVALFPPLTICALRLSILLAVLTGAAIAIGLLQPPSAWITLLHLSDCELPCWIGIEPGKTTFAEAQRQIEFVYGSSSAYVVEDYGFNVFGVVGKELSHNFTVRLASDVSGSTPSIVQKIYLSPVSFGDELPVQPILGELSNSLGKPEAVRLSISASESIFMVLYRGQRIEVYLNKPAACSRVSPNRQIVSILLREQPNNQGQYGGLYTRILPWRGFQRCYNF